MTVLPSSKMERWKYSNFAAIVPTDYESYPLAVTCDIDPQFITDGGEVIAPWAQETYEDMDLWAGVQDVLHVYIPADIHVENPVNLSMIVPDNVRLDGHISITLEKNAKLTLYESLELNGWVNRSMTITLEEGAELIHMRTGSGQGTATNLTQIRQAKNAVYKAYALNSYGQFVRDQIHARLEGEKAACYLAGSKILTDNQHTDTCILIEHMAPDCHSNQNYRNLLDGQSKGVFQGKVHVHQIAQKTDGYQLCNSILLSDKAEMNTKPELEIYADDVQCSHGATTAALDEDPLFYLMARGIPEDEARQLLIQAFLNESLDAFEENEDIYNELSRKITSASNA